MTSTPIDLCDFPAAVPPDGKSNFINPTTLAPVTIALGIILATIAVILTLGRTYVNRRKLCNADYFTLAACIINVAFTGVLVAQFKFNRHQWDIPVCWFTEWYFKIVFVQTMLFAPVFFTSKTAIFLLYRQIFAIEKRTRIAINFGLFFAVILYIPNILCRLSTMLLAGSCFSNLGIFYTSSRDSSLALWRPSKTSFYDTNKDGYMGIVQSSITILLDFYIFFLPLPIIARLNMPFNRRLQIIFVFTTALMGVIASVLSLVYRIKLLHTNDILWIQTITTICALVEADVTIIVGCMPAFAQLVKVHIGGSTFFQSMRSRFLGGSSNNRSGGASKGEQRPELATFGKNQSPRRRNYYELSDATLLKSQVTVDEGPEPSALAPDGIFRSVGFTQQFRVDSADDLA